MTKEDAKINKNISCLLEQIDWCVPQDEVFRHIRELVQKVCPVSKRNKILKLLEDYLDAEDVLKYIRALLDHPGLFESATDKMRYITRVLRGTGEDYRVFYKNMDGRLFAVNYIDLRELHKDILRQLKED